MFQIGFWELIVILVVALICVKPEQMPVLTRFLSRLLRQTKKILFHFKNELNY